MSESCWIDYYRQFFICRLVQPGNYRCLIITLSNICYKAMSLSSRFDMRN